MTIDLSSQEKELALVLVERELEEIRTEIHHARNHEYKDSLKARELLARGLRQKLESA